MVLDVLGQPLLFTTFLFMIWSHGQWCKIFLAACIMRYKIHQDLKRCVLKSVCIFIF